MNWEKAKNFIVGGGLVLVWLVTLAFLDWRVSVGVATALATQDLGTDAKIVSMDTSIADNKRTGDENAEDIDQNRDRVEAAFRVLTAD